MEQNRFRSPVLWTTVASLVCGLLMQIGVIGDAENKHIMEIVGTVLELFAIFGILNDPCVSDRF